MRVASVLGFMSTLLLGGCFYTTTPAILQLEAEDVGQILQYRRYHDPLNGDPQRIERFVRESSNEYRLQIHSAEESSENLEEHPFQNERAIFRTIGTKNHLPVYAVQISVGRENSIRFDADSKNENDYLVYLLFIDSNSVGSVGIYDCQDEIGLLNEFRNLAAKYALVYDCSTSVSFLSRIVTAQSTERVWSFLKESLDSGVVVWEDEVKREAGQYHD